MRRKTGLTLLFSLVLTLSLIVSCIPASATTFSASTTKKTDSFVMTQGIKNIIARAYHGVNIAWTPVKTVEGNYTKGKEKLTAMYYAGTTYYGLPYGQQDDSGLFVPADASFNTFLDAVNDSDSLFYTARGANNGRESLYYACDCSAFVSYCYDLPRMKTWNIAKSDLFTSVTDNSIYNAQIGDCFNKSSKHIELITDMIYDTEGNLVSVEVCEQTSPQIRSKVLTPEAVQKIIDDDDYTLLRYKNRNSVGKPVHYKGCYDKVSFAADDSVNVIAGEPDSVTVFQWNAQENAANYELRLWKGDYMESSPDYIVSTTDTSYHLNLPIGTYKGFIDAKAKLNGYSSAFNRSYVEFTVGVPLAISKQPASASVVQDETAKFTVEASGVGVNYQWQYRTSSKSSWKNVSSSSSKKDTLSVKAKSSVNGYQYRCYLTDSYNEKMYSNTVTLKVKPPIVITTQPKNVKVKSGKKAKFTVKATGKSLTYRWQYRKNSKHSWKNTSVKKNTYVLRVKKKLNGYQYRCLIKDSKGHYKYSKTVKLKVIK